MEKRIRNKILNLFKSERYVAGDTLNINLGPLVPILVKFNDLEKEAFVNAVNALEKDGLVVADNKDGTIRLTDKGFTYIYN